MFAYIILLNISYRKIYLHKENILLSPEPKNVFVNVFLNKYFK